MAELNKKSGCWGIICLLFIIGLIGQGIEKCSVEHHRTQDLIIPTGTFVTETDIWDIDFKTNGTNKALAYFRSKRDGSTYYVVYYIKYGNELYDESGDFSGYIIVKKNGDFKIKGSDAVLNGYYSLYSGNGMRKR